MGTEEKINKYIKNGYYPRLKKMALHPCSMMRMARMQLGHMPSMLSCMSGSNSLSHVLKHDGVFADYRFKEHGGQKRASLSKLVALQPQT